MLDRVYIAIRQRFAQFLLVSHIGLGIAVLLNGFFNFQAHDQLRFFSFAATAVLASVLKVRLPGVIGNVSLSALFVLIGIVNLSLPETLLLGTVSMLVQCYWRTAYRPRPIQVLFNVCVLGNTIYIASLAYTSMRGHVIEPVSLAVLAAVYFIANTFPVSCMIAVTERKEVRKVWGGYRWMLPYYAVGASIAWVIGTFPRGIQWEVPIICLPLVYLVHRSNQTYIEQAERDKKHMTEMNTLHLRTIEALALAIDAKDHNTHDHLQRVQLYATEIGKDLCLSELEMDALRAAAVLHDIGKLAVPESIISKPGKLTRAEFEKMKIHPVVGAEILERVEFPYPVVPIVRSHHEKWDGSGYPYGLEGKQIPIGARILAAVDCLDALASDRQYRRALPLDEAMAKVASEAGTSFDPAVVRALQNRYQELEERARQSTAPAPPPLSTDIVITRGSAPAAGFAADPQSDLHPVARARTVAPVRISSPETLEVAEALAVAAIRIKSQVPYDAIGVYGCSGELLISHFATGDDYKLLESLCVPLGEGLIGWVAENGQPMLNGNPAVEPGWSGSLLSSAIALPIVDSGRTIGVLALYRNAEDAFTADELVSLLPVCPTIAPVLTAGRATITDVSMLAQAVVG
jgi:putative nucleotidyltransferase with HDIG domain